MIQGADAGLSYQHVIYNGANGFFENVSACHFDAARDYSGLNAILYNVHTTLLASYPAQVYVDNYGGIGGHVQRIDLGQQHWRSNRHSADNDPGQGHIHAVVQLVRAATELDAIIFASPCEYGFFPCESPRLSRSRFPITFSISNSRHM